MKYEDRIVRHIADTAGMWHLVDECIPPGPGPRLRTISKRDRIHDWRIKTTCPMGSMDPRLYNAYMDRLGARIRGCTRPIETLWLRFKSFLIRGTLRKIILAADGEFTSNPEIQRLRRRMLDAAALRDVSR